MKKVGLVGWRGMVGSVLMQRMREENDFALIEPVFFTTSNTGGKAPNFDAASVNAACAALAKAGQREQVMIDCSHANSAKQPRKQMEVAASIAERIAAGERRILGVMVESHLREGRQDLKPGQPLTPGVSITDACLGWDDTVPLLRVLADAVRKRREL